MSDKPPCHNCPKGKTAAQMSTRQLLVILQQQLRQRAQIDAALARTLLDLQKEVQQLRASLPSLPPPPTAG